MAGRADLSGREARWLAIDAQRLGGPRPNGPITRRHLRTLIDAIGVVQLDAINVVARTQFLTLYSRLGAYDVSRVMAMTRPRAELFEYWGHMASVQPATTQPLFRWRMALGGPYSGGPKLEARRKVFYETHATYIRSILQEVGERGPLTAGQLTDPRRRDGEWWERRSVGRQALEWLFARGELAGWRTAGFERVYDVPERALPEDVLAQPTPPVEEAQRQLLALSARALGVGTVRDLADYYRIPTNAAKPRVAELVEDGTLVPVLVEGWREPGYTLPGVRARRPTRAHATVLSPFDSLIWDRARTSRVFGFDYRIEVYTPEAQRTYGYFVLPILLGDALVGRLDLKTDRKGSALQVRAAHLESDADAGEVAAALPPELHAMRQWLGVDGIAIGPRGGLARQLQRAVAVA